jgi:hypothetical protein
VSLRALVFFLDVFIVSLSFCVYLFVWTVNGRETRVFKSGHPRIARKHEQKKPGKAAGVSSFSFFSACFVLLVLVLRPFWCVLQYYFGFSKAEIEQQNRQLLRNRRPRRRRRRVSRKTRAGVSSGREPFLLLMFPSFPCLSVRTMNRRERRV